MFTTAVAALVPVLLSNDIPFFFNSAVATYFKVGRGVPTGPEVGIPFRKDGKTRLFPVGGDNGKVAIGLHIHPFDRTQMGQLLLSKVGKETLARNANAPQDV